MENNTFATASSGAAASETELEQLITAKGGNGSTDVIDEMTEEVETDGDLDGLEFDTGEDELTREVRWERNRQLREQFLECNLRIKQAQEAGDAAAEKVARRDRDRIGEEFVKANHGLAVRGARAFLIGRPEDRADHVQAALLGMWEALVGTSPDRVDDVVVDSETGKLTAAAGWKPDAGTFGNFSRPFISGRTRRSVRATEGAYTGMSYNAWGDRPKVERARNELLAETGRTPSVAEIAARAGVTVDTVHTVLTAAPVSLDKPVGEDGDTTLADLVADRIASLDGDELEVFRQTLVDRAHDMKAVDLMVFLLHTGAVLGRPARSMVDTAAKLGLGRGAVQLAFARAIRSLHGEPAEETSADAEHTAAAVEAAVATEPQLAG